MAEGAHERRRFLVAEHLAERLVGHGAAVLDDASERQEVRRSPGTMMQGLLPPHSKTSSVRVAAMMALAAAVPPVK